MVKLNIIVEGGVQLSNASADTASNVEALRQSFHKFFTKVLNVDNLDITVFMGWGCRMAAKRFLNESNESCLFVDSDAPYDTRYRWFDRLVNEVNPEKTIIIPDVQKQTVFFMIQEMEAWFLKQPECLDRWAIAEGYGRKDANVAISNHSLVRDKDIENISKPSEKLAIIMKRYFFKDKKSARYGKLKTAPSLLDALDVTALMPLDRELKRFKTSFGEDDRLASL